MLPNKLAPTEAAELMVGHAEKYLSSEIANRDMLIEQLNSMRKNAKTRKRQQDRIEESKNRIDRALEKLENAKELLSVADKISEITYNINQLCQQRDSLTPNQVGAYVDLFSVMRNGFM